MRPQVDIERHKVLVGLWHLQGGACAYCGRGMPHPDSLSSNKPLTNPTIDHMTPLSRGGLDTIENRCAACDGCNQAKGNLDAATFVRVRLNPQMLRTALWQAGLDGNAAKRAREEAIRADR